MKRSFLRFALAVAFCAAPLMAAAAPAPVKTRLGMVEGVAGRTAGVAAYKGIPFAAPPVGELRWRAPQAAKPWTGVLKADHFSPHCAQNIVDSTGPWTREFMPHGDTSEDCLYLNVWTAGKSNEKRPVFFYIHGGAFTGGSGAVALYDGEGLAGKGLVVVTVNYRVGPFGFFAHPELTRESGRNASGNQGLLDMVAALEWVRDNIAAFGGDPGNVTIAGQSAGSMAVHCLLASPLAKGLFHRAVAQSGGSTLGSNERKLADAEAEGVRFAQARGASTLADLRKLTPAQLLATQGGASARYGPIADGYLLPAPIAEIVAQGKQNDVPILTGATADEGGASPTPTTTLEAFQRQAQRFGETFARLYPAANNAEAGQANNASSRDQQRVNISLWAQARAKTSKAKIYTYFWTHAMPGPDAARLGAFHSSELAYMFRTLYMSDRPFNAEDQRIAEQMSTYWANFARTGNPNGKGLPAWPSTAEQPDVTMQLGDKSEPVPLAGSPERLAFWRETLAKRR